MAQAFQVPNSVVEWNFELRRRVYLEQICGVFRNEDDRTTPHPHSNARGRRVVSVCRVGTALEGPVPFSFS